MKFHLALTDGTWIGGMTTRRALLLESLTELVPVAKQWGLSIVATRVGKFSEAYRVNTAGEIIRIDTN